MNFPGFLKKKRTYILLVIVLIGAGWFWQRQQAANKITYETFAAERRDLLQTVEVTGEIEPASRIDLAFQNGGTLKEVYVDVGQDVMTGELLAELNDEDLSFAYRRAEAAYALASANLNQALAGESSESIRVSEAQLEQARAAYDQAVSDLENTRIQVQNDLENAEIALQTAKNNLDNAGPVSDQTFTNAVETARLVLKSALVPMNAALIEGDAVVGVDDTNTNQLYKSSLGALNEGSMLSAQNSYRAAKASKQSASLLVDKITISSSKTDVVVAADALLLAIEDVQSFLLDVKTVLANSITSVWLPASQLSALKTSMDTYHTSVSSQKSTVVSARQGIDVAELSQTSDRGRLEDALRSAEVAFEIAKTNIDTKIKTAESAVAIQKASMDASQAALDLKKAPPRSVDVAGLRAAVLDAKVALDQAEGNLNKIRIFAPVDGTITDVVSDVGELVSAQSPQLRMIGTKKYDIEAQVPEADITKVKVGQIVEVTLDAYGDDLLFNGTVTSENPDQTVVQEAIYYDVRVTLDPKDYEIKPGMTANVTIRTAEANNAIVIPLRAVRTNAETGQKTVRVLVNGEPVVRDVTLGLKGDEGRVQVLTGVAINEEVVLREIVGNE